MLRGRYESYCSFAAVLRLARRFEPELAAVGVTAVGLIVGTRAMRRAAA
jgi:hypothetical protein